MKHRKTDSAHDRGGLIASIGQSLTGPRFHETDEVGTWLYWTRPQSHVLSQWFDRQKGYLDSLESQLKSLVKAIEMVAKQRQGELGFQRQILDSHLDLWRIGTSQWGICSDHKRSCFFWRWRPTFSVPFWSCGCWAKSTRTSDDSVRSGHGDRSGNIGWVFSAHQFCPRESPLISRYSENDWYVFSWLSVRGYGHITNGNIPRVNYWGWRSLTRKIKRRDKTRGTGWVILYSKLLRCVEFVINGSLFGQQKIQAERRASECKLEFEQVSKLVKQEMARFERERIGDFKDSLHAFLEGMIARQKEVSLVSNSARYIDWIFFSSSFPHGRTISKRCSGEQKKHRARLPFSVHKRRWRWWLR